MFTRQVLIISITWNSEIIVQLTTHLKSTTIYMNVSIVLKWPLQTGVVQRKRLQVMKQLKETGTSGNFRNIPKNAPKDHREEIYPRIHGMVFSPGDGLMKRLEVDFDSRIGDLSHIYDLYDPKQHK